jgi:predicted small lipoprotein YifL
VKFFPLALAVVCCLATLAGCSKNGGVESSKSSPSGTSDATATSTSPKTDPRLTGTWKYKDLVMTPAGIAVTKQRGISVADVKKSVSSTELIFKDDQSFTMTGPAVEMGAYKVEGNAVKIEIATINKDTPEDIIARAKVQYKDQPDLLKKLLSRNIKELNAKISEDGKEVVLVDPGGSQLFFTKAK